MSAHTLSSTAERCYWFGRYLERVEATARMVTVHANLLMDLPRRLPEAWQPLVEITGSLGLAPAARHQRSRSMRATRRRSRQGVGAGVRLR